MYEAGLSMQQARQRGDNRVWRQGGGDKNYAQRKQCEEQSSPDGCTVRLSVWLTSLIYEVAAGILALLRLYNRDAESFSQVWGLWSFHGDVDCGIGPIIIIPDAMATL